MAKEIMHIITTYTRNPDGHVTYFTWCCLNSDRNKRLVFSSLLYITDMLEDHYRPCKRCMAAIKKEMKELEKIEG